MSEQWRPAFCPDPGCTPLIHPLTDPDNMDPGFARQGYAVFCFGRLAEPIDWTFAGVEHHETLSQCQMSPLKGNVRWLDNAEDWSALTRAYRAATSAAVESERQPCDFPRQPDGTVTWSTPCSVHGRDYPCQQPFRDDGYFETCASCVADGKPCGSDHK